MYKISNNSFIKTQYNFFQFQTEKKFTESFLFLNVWPVLITAIFVYQSSEFILKHIYGDNIRE